MIDTASPPAETPLDKALAKLGPLGGDVFVEICAKRKDKAKGPACRRFRLSYEEYFELRKHFAHRIEAKWLAAGYVGSFVSRSQPPEDL